jgi:hypothetical protein
MYDPSKTNLEAGMMDAQGNTVASAKGTLTLPIKTETQAEAMANGKLMAQLGVMVPYVQCDTIAVELDYTIKNLDGSNAGQARVHLNGANEFFAYDPTILVLDPGDDEAPPAPDLQGNIPIDIPAGGTYNGVFREDQMLEASVDLDEVTRGNVNPFAATQSLDDRDAPSFQPLSPLMFDMDGNPLPQTAVGMPIPRAAFPHIIRVDMRFEPTTHMVMDFDVRIRDLVNNIVDDKGGDAPMSELQAFDNIMTFTAGGGSAGGSGGSGGSGSGSGA